MQQFIHNGLKETRSNKALKEFGKMEEETEKKSK